MHKQAGEIVYAHNIAVFVLTAELDRLRAENEAKDAAIAALQADAERWVYVRANGVACLQYKHGEWD
jgi:hypothetical protein